MKVNTMAFDFLRPWVSVREEMIGSKQYTPYRNQAMDCLGISVQNCEKKKPEHHM